MGIYERNWGCVSGVEVVLGALGVGCRVCERGKRKCKG